MNKKKVETDIYIYGISEEEGQTTQQIHIKKIKLDPYITQQRKNSR